MKANRPYLYLSIVILFYILISSFTCGKDTTSETMLLYLKNMTNETLYVDYIYRNGHSNVDKHYFSRLLPNDSTRYAIFYDSLDVSIDEKDLFKGFYKKIGMECDRVIYKYQDERLVCVFKLDVSENEELRDFFFNPKRWRKNFDKIVYDDHEKSSTKYSWTFDILPEHLSR